MSTRGCAQFGLRFAKQFVVLWTLARIRISQELIRVKAPSEGNLHVCIVDFMVFIIKLRDRYLLLSLIDTFNTLATLFDDFCVYKVKDIFFDDCTTMLFGNATKNVKPTLPYYFDPLGKCM